MKPIVLASFRLCETHGVKGIAWYVSRVKGDGGRDWEWTRNANEAAVVSYYWARRFMADRAACGVKTAQAIEVR